MLKTSVLAWVVLLAALGVSGKYSTELTTPKRPTTQVTTLPTTIKATTVQPIYAEIQTTQVTTIPTTIKTTHVTTIPTTRSVTTPIQTLPQLTTQVTTIPTTIKTTHVTTIPTTRSVVTPIHTGPQLTTQVTTIPTTIKTTHVTTIPTTRSVTTPIQTLPQLTTQVTTISTTIKTTQVTTIPTTRSVATPIHTGPQLTTQVTTIPTSRSVTTPIFTTRVTTVRPTTIETSTTPCQPGQICEDFDECAAGTDDCGQNTVCVNDFGGFHCECKPGYYPNPDGKSCRDCPSGYRRYRDDCYRFWGGKNAKTYSGARQVCQENGGDIYMWKSAAAVARLKRKLVSNDAPSVWIGLSDENPEGTWIWADGMVLGGSDFINWSPDPPHNTDRKDCAVARKVHRYRWKAVPCSYRRAFICHSLRAP